MFIGDTHTTDAFLIPSIFITFLRRVLDARAITLMLDGMMLLSSPILLNSRRLPYIKILLYARLIVITIEQNHYAKQRFTPSMIYTAVNAYTDPACLPFLYYESNKVTHIWLLSYQISPLFVTQDRKIQAGNLHKVHQAAYHVSTDEGRGQAFRLNRCFHK